ncbi:MAG TPA: adenylate cyclase regulatory domain-containing protein [Solirubrobacteraceae bacterium]|jgi:adenylate cyclase|nr:adenylate cyclase regulatory domain-containing protein [Solirubrobacteraceae bacterium]
MDFAAAGLLDDLTGEERAQREQLLTRLVQDGFTEEELATAVRENRLALLPVDRVLGGTRTAREIEEATGLPAATMIRIRRQHGLPEADADARVFSDEDIEAARSMKLFLDAGFGEERIDEITRVLGESMARLSATITAAFAETFLEPGASEEAVATRFATLAEQLTPAFGPILVAGFKDHLRDSVQRGMLGLAELEAGDIAGAQELAVCFADLVGFTRLGGQVEVRELGTVAGRLASVAAAVTTAPVRLVKTIGDAAMFVSPDPAPLVGVALDLVEAFAEEELPSLRAGIAWGPAMVRAGDYYGNSVNLASRVTGVARPGSVLCTREVHDSARGAYAWSAAGRYKLKGVSGPTVLYRARHRDDGGAADD